MTTDSRLTLPSATEGAAQVMSSTLSLSCKQSAGQALSKLPLLASVYNTVITCLLHQTDNFVQSTQVVADLGGTMVPPLYVCEGADYMYVCCVYIFVLYSHLHL